MVFCGRNFLLCLFILIGIAPAVAQKPAKDVFGQTLGASEWGPLKVSQSQLSLTSNEFVVVKRVGRNLPNRYQESLLIKNGGRITFEELFAGFFSDSYSSDEYLVDLSNRHTKKQKIVFTASDIKKSGFEEGELFFATKSSATDVCAVFNANFGVTGTYGRYGGKHLFGGVCRKRKHAEAKDLGKKVFAFINAIRFDDGQLNKVTGAIEEEGARRQSKKVTDHFDNAKPVEPTGGGKVNLLACFNNPENCKK